MWISPLGIIIGLMPEDLDAPRGQRLIKHHFEDVTSHVFYPISILVLPLPSVSDELDHQLFLLYWQMQRQQHKLALTEVQNPCQRWKLHLDNG